MVGWIGRLGELDELTRRVTPIICHQLIALDQEHTGDSKKITRRVTPIICHQQIALDLRNKATIKALPII